MMSCARETLWGDLWGAIWLLHGMHGFRGCACLTWHVMVFTAPKPGSDSDSEPEQKRSRRLAQAGGSRCVSAGLLSPLCCSQVLSFSPLAALKPSWSVSNLARNTPLSQPSPAMCSRKDNVLL